MELFKKLESGARKKGKTIILPESYDPRVISAVRQILRKRTAKVLLIETGKKIPLQPSKNLTVIDINFSAQFAGEYLRMRRRKTPGYGLKRALHDLKDPLKFACMLLKNGFGDSVVSGSVYPTSEVLRSAISIIGLMKNNRTVSSFFLFTFPFDHIHRDRVIAFADCGVTPEPNAVQLSDIAIQTSINFKKLTGHKPKAAFLSFSTKGSASHGSVDRILKAIKMTRIRAPWLVCDGELQFDAAFIPEVAYLKDPHGHVRGDANVFIFPDLNSGNIAYKITERVGGASATGPIVQGLAKPVMDLSRGCSSRDIVNMVTVASVLKAG